MAITPRLTILSICLFTKFCFSQAPIFRWETNEPFASFKGDEKQQTSLVEYVLQRTGEIDSFTIFIAADTAYKLNKFAEAAFLFHAARIRAGSDALYFPYKHGGSDSPGIYIAFLNENSRQVIANWMFTNLDMFNTILDMLSQWDPSVTTNYKPGWEVTEPPVQNGKLQSRLEIKNNYLKPLMDMGKLFKIPEYKSHYMAVNPFLPSTWNLLKTTEGKSELTLHLKKLLEIENKQGIKGYASTQKLLPLTD